jgi:heme o synthase
MIKDYHQLVKPGIVYSNTLAAAAGFFVAANSTISFPFFAAMLVGIATIIASGCVFNNYIDRDIDAVMKRTKNRPLVRGTISPHNALNYGIVLALVGSVCLYFTNWLTLAVALFGLFMYAVVYSVWCKRHTLHATVIGAVSGAIPPVVGYTALTNSLDLGAWLLFLILFTWQIPHALAIAIRRYEDYRAANIPVMPVALGIMPAKAQILAYTCAFFLASIALSLTNYTGTLFLTVMAVLGILWFVRCLQGFWTKDDKQWAKQVFLFSLVILCAFCILCAIDFVIQAL